MVLFKSKQPNIKAPSDLTIWEWLFESKTTSPLFKGSTTKLGAFVDTESNERLDWAQVRSRSTQLSTVLGEHYDLKPCDTVSIFSGNNIWYPICMFAAVRAGAMVSGAPATYTIDEMEYALEIAKTKLLFTVPAAVGKALAAARRVGIPSCNVLLLRGEAAGVRSIQDLIDMEADLEIRPYYRLPLGVTNKDLCGYLNFSSGTTGLPKAVMLSHHNIIAQCYQMHQLQIDRDNVKILAITPLHHITGTWRFLHYPILANGNAFILPAFTMEAMLKAVVKFEIEELLLVPPILLRLVRDPIVDQYDLRMVKRWTSGAAPLSQHVLRSLEQRFPWTGFRQAYGSTEAPCISSQPPTHYAWKHGLSVGTLMANTVAKVVDDQGRELGIGRVGEILVRGPQVAMGYLYDAGATAESFDAEGFYHTGDAGYFDEEGQIFIEDRLKEMIKVKGHQVPPAELEHLLLGHDIVADCAVTGQPDNDDDEQHATRGGGGGGGELPKAFVVLKRGVPVTDAAGYRLLEFVREEKSRYKWLAEVEFVDHIPKSPTGKLLRRVLKDWTRSSSSSSSSSSLSKTEGDNGRSTGFSLRVVDHRQRFCKYQS